MPIALIPCGVDGHATERNAGAAIEREATMHIHPNNNPMMASLGAAREDVQQIQAKRAAEVRRKLSAASRVSAFSADQFAGAARQVEARSGGGGEGESQEDGDAFGRLFSAEA